eukprot:TRINITY_DN436_c0_g1_i1.p1 TRINITY_DN436_c0_g1~~TRINITY_DN436_c0_g1_i1.p1  ORF type:complete len:276 (+),score=76.64 TRINITY_DN436_c0_g1_i1:49-876(+)
MRLNSNDLRFYVDQTIQIMEDKEYYCIEKKIDISQELDAAVNNAKHFHENELRDLPLPEPNYSNQTIIEINDESTIGAAKRVYDRFKDNCCFLNFANPVEPGGGFLRLARAQEENCCLASGLYATLIPQTSYYQRGKEADMVIGTNDVIYSPKVPIFRNEETHLLSEPFCIDIVTSAAPCFSFYADYPANYSDIIKERLFLFLKLMVNKGIKNVILGAYGCGAFRNVTRVVAEAFKSLLENEFKGLFNYVTFSIPNKEGRNYQNFERHLSSILTT